MMAWNVTENAISLDASSNNGANVLWG